MSDLTNLSVEDEIAIEVIQECAKAILNAARRFDVVSVNQLLAELEPYPSLVLRVVEVD